MAKLNLDLAGVSVFGQRVVVPSGKYPVRVANVEVTQNKAKTGGFVKVDFEITEGEHEGVVIVDRYNIQHQNEKVVKMAYSKLKSILVHGGAKNPNKLVDTDEMLGLCLCVLVSEDPHSFQGDDGKMVDTTQNEIKGFFPFTAVAIVKSEEKKEEVVVPNAAMVKEEKEQTAFPWS